MDFQRLNVAAYISQRLEEPKPVTDMHSDLSGLLKLLEKCRGVCFYLRQVGQKEALNACQPGLREIVALAVSTGMRRGEILGFRYLDVDIANRRILLPQTKNGDGRVVYLNDMAMMVFQSWPTGKPTDRVYAGWSPGYMSLDIKTWRRRRDTSI